MSVHTDRPAHRAPRFWYLSSFFRAVLAIVLAVALTYLLLVLFGPKEPLTAVARYEVGIRPETTPAVIEYFPLGVDPSGPHLSQLPAFLSQWLTCWYVMPIVKGMFVVSIVLEALDQLDLRQAVVDW